MRILWATKIEDKDRSEQIITQHEERIEASSIWALANGFNRLRVAYFDDIPQAPDFTKIFNTK